MSTLSRQGRETSGASQPKVSALLQTYNHEPYIAQAIESVLVQRGAAPFEIVIADDCSTDGTRAIVEEYARSRPDLFRLVLPERNLGAGQIFLRALESARGEYVAYLDGDDYWTSPDKLRKQARALDTHPKWATCFHDAMVFFDDGSKPSRPATPAFHKDTFELEDILRSCFIPGPSWMVRRAACDAFPSWAVEFAWSDWLLHICAARHASIGYIDEVMAAWRVHPGGMFSSRDRSDQIEEDLRVYEHLLGVMPEHRALIERCIVDRRCQLAVEEAGLPYDGPLIVLDESADIPLYFNGRHAQHLPLPPAGEALSGASAVLELERLCGETARPPAASAHYRPRVEPRAAEQADGYAIVSRSVSRRVSELSQLAGLLAGAPTIWSDEWCEIHELRVDSGRATRKEVKGSGHMGALVEILDVSVVEPVPNGLRGRFIDRPIEGSVVDAHVIDLLGWVLGERTSAVAVELVTDDRVFWRAELGEPRPDLAEAFPDHSEAGEAGFRTTINALGTAPEFELEVRAVLHDQTRIPIGTIRGRHRWRQQSSPAFADLVSIVIPCFGQAHYLDEAIESVLAQTYPHLEIVVIDDGSPDNASAVAARYPGARHVRQENGGVAAARNAGIRSTNGDFLIFLDADDRLLPNAVEAGLRSLREHPECPAAIGWYHLTAQDGSAVAVGERPNVEPDPYGELLKTNWAGFPGRAIYRRSVFEHVKGFDGDVSPAEDYDLNLRIAQEFPIRSHGDEVAEHRQHRANASEDAAAMLTQTLAAHRKQRPTTRKDPRRTVAYKEGRRAWREYYGEPLVDQARRSMRERRLIDALRELGVLLRRYPRGLPKMLAWRRTPVIR